MTPGAAEVGAFLKAGRGRMLALEFAAREAETARPGAASLMFRLAELCRPVVQAWRLQEAAPRCAQSSA